MANAITRHIPNTVTCLNLFSGCIAGVMAFEAKYELAFIFIILSAVFDFFDGMLARLLHAYSPIGKDLAFAVSQSSTEIACCPFVNCPDHSKKTVLGLLGLSGK